MGMKKIEKPWPECISSINADTLNTWFNKNIEGKYLFDESDLVEVFSYKYSDNSNGNWSEKYDLLEDTHKAYLIKSSIEPIKKESLKDVVSEILEFTKINDLGDNYIDRFDLERLERALKVENDRV